MKILFLTTMAGVPWGGSEVLWSTTASYALLTGHEVAVVLYDWTIDTVPIQRLLGQGMAVIKRHRYQKKSYFRRFIGRISVQFGIQRKPGWCHVAAGYDPDIICVSSGNTFEPFEDKELWRFLDEFHGPKVHICHLNTEFFTPTEVLRTSAISRFAEARLVLFVSRSNLETARRQLACQLENAKVIRNPVNLSTWEPTSYPSFCQSNLRFACVARLDVKYKGHDLLIEVLSGPEWRERDWELHIYGEGKDEAYIRKLIVYFGLEGRVYVHGHVKDINSIWSVNHVHVLASRAEGTPLSLVESMIMARPAVVTDVGGNSEWVEEGVSGFIAEGCTVYSVRRAFERMWENRFLLKSMGEAARAFALANVDYAPEQTLLRYFAEVTDGHCGHVP